MTMKKRIPSISQGTKNARIKMKDLFFQDLIMFVIKTEKNKTQIKSIKLMAVYCDLNTKY